MSGNRTKTAGNRRNRKLTHSSDLAGKMTVDGMTGDEFSVLGIVDFRSKSFGYRQSGIGNRNFGFGVLT